MAYRLALSPELASVHNVFHVSILLINYIPDPSHILNQLPNEVREDSSYEEKPVEILDPDEKVLNNKVILLV